FWTSANATSIIASAPRLEASVKIGCILIGFPPRELFFNENGAFPGEIGSFPGEIGSFPGENGSFNLSIGTILPPEAPARPNQCGASAPNTKLDRYAFVLEYRRGIFLCRIGHNRLRPGAS